MKKILSAVLLSAISTCAAAQTTTAPAHITQIVTGWNSEVFSVNIGTPLPNPAGCPATDIAASAEANPGYKTFYAAALTAFSNDTPVVLVVSNTTCEGARPRLIGITLGR